jgi:hypothetical protein
MDEGELRAAGFEWEAQNAYQGSWVAGLVATGPGFFFHGLGHLYTGDSQTGWSLLGSEGLGLGLMLAGTLLYASGDEASLSQGFGLGLGQVGGATFALGWMSDMMGSFKGSEQTFLPVTMDRGRFGGRAAYSVVSVPGLDVHQLLDVSLLGDFGVAFVRPYASLDPLLEYQLYGGEAGLRVVQGSGPQDWLALKLRVERAQFGPQSGAQVELRRGVVLDSVLRSQGTVGASLDLGQVFEHLRHAVHILDVGIGFADRGELRRVAVPGERGGQAYFVLEQSVAVNLSSSMTLRPFYIYSAAELVAPLDVGLGVFGAELRLTPSEGLEVSLQGKAGDGVVVSAGLVYWLR